MADHFQIGVEELRRANLRGAAQNRSRVLRVSGQAVTISEVEQRTGLAGRTLTTKLARIRKKGDAVTWEALT